MSHLTVQLACDSAAFDGDPGIEAARILRVIADRLELGDTSGRALDVNGNIVGNFLLTLDE